VHCSDGNLHIPAFMHCCKIPSLLWFVVLHVFKFEFRHQINDILSTHCAECCLSISNSSKPTLPPSTSAYLWKHQIYTELNILLSRRVTESGGYDMSRLCSYRLLPFSNERQFDSQGSDKHALETTVGRNIPNCVP
jgi:hypothetical protein